MRRINAHLLTQRLCLLLARRHLPHLLAVLLCDSGETAKTLLLPVILLRVVLVVAVVSAIVAAEMVVKTHADLATGAVMGTIVAEIVIRVGVEVAQISGTSSLLSLVLLPPLPLHNSNHVTITLDNRPHLECRSSSKCQCMIPGSSGCRRHRSNNSRASSSSSNRTVRRMHPLMMDIAGSKAQCQSSKVTHRSLQAHIFLGRKMVLAEMAIAS